MTTITNDIENTAIRSIRNLTLETLCDSYEITNTIEECEDFRNVAVVRGWLMDELERRYPEKFLQWLETENIELMDTPSKFFL